ncbi:MAG: hypothetical protein ACOY3I_08350 [Verrucomicrobiota bacterium]
MKINTPIDYTYTNSKGDQYIVYENGDVEIQRANRLRQIFFFSRQETIVEGFLRKTLTPKIEITAEGRLFDGASEVCLV